MPTLIATPGAVDANTYATLAEAETYFDGRLHASAWTAATDDTKKKSLIMAARLLDAAWIWNGRKSLVLSEDQRMEWPRIGVLLEAGTNTWDLNTGTFRFVDQSEIPDKLKDAQCEYSLNLIKSDRSADLDQAVQGLTSLRVGTIALSFKESLYTQVVPDAVVYLVPYWWGYLRTKGGGVRELERF